MRALALALAAVAVAAAAFVLPACRTNPLVAPESGDGGAANGDLGRPPTYDLAAVRCDGLDEVVASLLDAPQTCVAESDCITVDTRCGLPGGCGVLVSKATAEALKSPLASWDAQGCGDAIDCGPCPRSPDRPPVCLGGRCRPAPTTCDEIRALFDALKASSANSCAGPSDCVTTTGPCGLDDCRLVYSRAVESEVRQLTGWWGALSCPWNGGACAKCPMPAPAVCVAGRCQ
jgi:hypothetical protein